jgi:hypothetical protein
LVALAISRTAPAWSGKNINAIWQTTTSNEASAAGRAFASP